jgi:hypothetical protein
LDKNQGIMDQNKINEINAKYCDRLFKLYQDFGQFSHLILRREVNIQISAEDKAVYAENGLEWFPTLTGFMILTGYFYDHEMDQYYSLTEKGNLAKELGGHEAYRKYRQKEINVIRNQSKINNWLIGATILAALSPIIVELIKNTFFSEKSKTQSVPSVIVKIDTSLLSPYIEDQKSKIVRPKESSQSPNRSHKPSTIQSH